MSFPKVVVQILLYITPPEEFDRLMSSLEAVDYPKENWKIVVLKNFSEKAQTSADCVRENWLPKSGQTLPEIIFAEQSPNLGFAGGHVKAVELSRDWQPDYLYLLNDDTWVDPNFLIKAITLAEENQQAALVQSLVMLDDGQRINSIGNAMHFLGFGFTLGHGQLLEEVKNNLPTFYSSGAGLLIRTAVLEEIGGLFEPLYGSYHEDLDLSWRARLANYDIVLAPDSKIFHHYEFSKSITKFYFMERNRHLTNLTHYKWSTLILISPIYLVMELGTLLFAFRSGWWLEKIKSWTYFLRLSTWRWVFKKRKLISGLRKKIDKELLSSMVGVIVNQEVKNPILEKIVNPITNWYFRLLKFLVFW